MGLEQWEAVEGASAAALAAWAALPVAARAQVAPDSAAVAVTARASSAAAEMAAAEKARTRSPHCR